MAAERACTECGKPLGKDADKRKLTCSERCRQARARRRKRRSNDTPPAVWSKAADAVEGADASHIAREIFERELTPLVREQITEDVVKSIGELIKLTPDLIASLGRDLLSTDDATRGRAQGLVAKYTLGNPTAAPRDVTDDRTLQVNLNIPSPDNPGAAPPTVVDTDALRECDVCHKDLPESQFVAGSDRCQECHAGMRDRVTQQYLPVPS